MKSVNPSLIHLSWHYVIDLLMTSIKKFLYTFILLLLSIGVALLLGEGLIRGLYKDKMVLFPRYFTDYWYGEYHMRRTRPTMNFTHKSVDGVFHFVTNEKGFRNIDSTPYKKRPGEFRVLVLGDSHTFGYEVNQQETYAAVTEKLLREKGFDATVINAGISGTGTAEQLVFLEQEGLRYDPDVVVLGFFSNDFDDNLKSSFFKLDTRDSLVVDKKEHLPGVKIQNFIYQFRWVHWLSENSYLYNFAFNTVWDLFKKRSLDQGKQVVDEMAVSTGEVISPYALRLEEKLAKKLRSTLKDDTQLIIVDIPNYDRSSSVPLQLVPAFQEAADTFFYAPAMQNELAALGATSHVPHGQRHMAPPLHKLLGEKIAAYIAATYP